MIKTIFRTSLVVLILVTALWLYINFSDRSPDEPGVSNDPVPTASVTSPSETAESRDEPAEPGSLPYSFLQFLKLFNGEVPYGNSLANRFSKGELMRNQSIRNLMTADLQRELGDENVTEFVRNITESYEHDLFELADSAWFAQTTNRALFRGNAIALGVTLKYQPYTDRGNGWAIVGVSKNIFADMDQWPSEQSMLMPIEHELDFSGLEYKFKERVLDFMYDGYQVDQLSIFMHLIHTGELQVGAVEQVRFFSLQYDPWFFTIEESGPDEREEGWRIVQAYKFANDMEKACFLQDNLNISFLSGHLPGRTRCEDSFNEKQENLSDEAVISFSRQLVDSLSLTFAEFSRNGLSPVFLRRLPSLFASTETKLYNDLTVDGDSLVPLESYLVLLHDFTQNSKTGPLNISLQLNKTDQPKAVQRLSKQYISVPVVKYIEKGTALDSLLLEIMVDPATKKIELIQLPPPL